MIYVKVFRRKTNAKFKMQNAKFPTGTRTSSVANAELRGKCLLKTGRRGQDEAVTTTDRMSHGLRRKFWVFTPHPPLTWIALPKT